MALFQYPTYENRLAGSIGDILARRGEIASAAAQRAGIILSNGTRQVGDIQARADQQSGQAWGNAASQMGGAVARVPAEAQAFTTAQTRQKLEQSELDARTQQASDLKAIDTAYQNSGGNRAAVIDALPGHLRGKVADDFEKFDKAHAEAQELQQKADAAKVAAFATAGMSIRGHGYDPQAAQLTISDLKAKYRGDPQSLDQLGRFEQALHANPTPETVKGIIDPILQADPKTREDLAKEAADAETKRNHDLEDAGRKATAAETAARDTQTRKDEDARRVLEGRRVVAEETNARTSASKEKREQATFDQTYGAGGTNPDGTPKPIPISATARAMANYQLAPLSPRSAATGAGKALTEQILAANPDYDATQYATRAAMRKAYTSGNQSQQLGALNTAIAHLGVLDDMAKSLDNGSFKPGNELYNTVRTMFGSSAVTNFAFARDIMSGELATAMKKSGATDVEISKVSKSLDDSASPKQLSDAIRTVAIPMIAGGRGTWRWREGWRAGYGSGADGGKRRRQAADHGAGISAGG